MKCIAIFVLLLLSNLALSNQQFDTNLSQKEMNCLYLNAYFEGNNDSVIAQQGIIEVVLNRKKLQNQSDACSIIYAKNAFSWTRKKHKIPINQQYVFKLTQLVVDTIIDGMRQGVLQPLTYGATFYHADYVNPCWLPDMQFVNKLGKHIFYKQGITDSHACYKKSLNKTMIAEYSPYSDPILLNVQQKFVCQYCELQPVSFTDVFDPQTYKFERISIAMN